MSIRDFLTQDLGASHLFMLDDASRDAGSNGVNTTGGISSGSFVPNPVCEGVTNSFQSSDNGTGESNGFVIGNTNDINVGTDIWREYSIAMWCEADEVGAPTVIYEQGGGTNNHAIALGLSLIHI